MVGPIATVLAEQAALVFARVTASEVPRRGMNDASAVVTKTAFITSTLLKTVNAAEVVQLLMGPSTP